MDFLEKVKNKQELLIDGIAYALNEIGHGPVLLESRTAITITKKAYLALQALSDQDDSLAADQTTYESAES